MNRKRLGPHVLAVGAAGALAWAGGPSFAESPPRHPAPSPGEGAPRLARTAERPEGPNADRGRCRLGADRGDIEHVIYIQFDNTHFRRDNPSVPSDLEQIPSLLTFMEHHGTLFTNDHTVLISHTAGGILSSLTGLYPDRHGQTVSDSYVRTSSTGTFSFPGSFGYWTDSVSAAGTPTVPNMVGPDGTNIPAPWVPFTRRGRRRHGEHRAGEHRDRPHR
jgi:hypothetical protein